MYNPWKHYAVWRKPHYKRPHIICFTLYELSRLVKVTETDSRLMVARGCREGRIEPRVSFEGNKNTLKLIMVMVAQFQECTKNDWTVHFKWVYFMVYELS